MLPEIREALHDTYFMWGKYSVEQKFFAKYPETDKNEYEFELLKLENYLQEMY